jgi:hypothetical protein
MRHSSEGQCGGWRVEDRGQGMGDGGWETGDGDRGQGQRRDGDGSVQRCHPDPWTEL